MISMLLDCVNSIDERTYRIVIVEVEVETVSFIGVYGVIIEHFDVHQPVLESFRVHQSYTGG